MAKSDEPKKTMTITVTPTDGKSQLIFGATEWDLNMDLGTLSIITEGNRPNHLFNWSKVQGIEYQDAD